MPPANDNFANALVLSGASGSITPIDTTGATNETGEPHGVDSVYGYALPNNFSIWFKWTAPSSGTTFFSTDGSIYSDGSPNLDTTLTVYTGSALTALTQVVANDDINGYPLYSSHAEFAAVAGTTYYIQVGAYGGTTGFVHLSWGAPAPPPTPPPNDDFADAIVLTGSKGDVAGTLVAATAETGEPDVFSNPTPRQTVWYSWVAPVDADNMAFAIEDANELANLAVYTGTDFSDLTEVMHAYGSGYNTFAAVAGTQYWIQIDGWHNASNHPGAFELFWSDGSPVASEPFSFVALAGSKTYAADSGGSTYLQAPIRGIVPAGRFLVALAHVEESRASPGPVTVRPYGLKEAPGTPTSPVPPGELQVGGLSRIGESGQIAAAVSDGSVITWAGGGANSSRAGVWAPGSPAVRKDPNNFDGIYANQTRGLCMLADGSIVGTKDEVVDPGLSAFLYPRAVHYDGATATPYPDIPDLSASGWNKSSKAYYDFNESGTGIVRFSYNTLHSGIGGPPLYERIFLVTLAAIGTELDSVTGTPAGTYSSTYSHSRIAASGFAAWTKHTAVGGVIGSGLYTVRRSSDSNVFAVSGRHCILLDVTSSGECLIAVCTSYLGGGQYPTDRLAVWHADNSITYISDYGGPSYFGTLSQWEGSCMNDHGDVFANCRTSGYGPSYAKPVWLTGGTTVWRDATEMGFDYNVSGSNEGPERGDFGPEVAAQFVLSGLGYVQGRYEPRRIANDLRANATVCSGYAGRVNGTLVNCTRDASEPTPFTTNGPATAWFKWTAPISGSVQFTLTSPYASAAHLQFAIYHGSTLLGTAVVVSTYSPIAISFIATAGETYEVLVGTNALPNVDQPSQKCFVVGWRMVEAPPIPVHATSCSDNESNAWTLLDTGWTAVSVCHVENELRSGDTISFLLDAPYGPYAVAILEFAGVPGGAALALGGDGCGGTTGVGLSGCLGGSTEALEDDPWEEPLASALVVAGNVARYGAGSGPSYAPAAPTGYTPDEAGFTYLDALDTGLSPYNVGVYLQPSWKLAPLTDTAPDPGLVWTPSHWWSIGAGAVSAAVMGVISLRRRLVNLSLGG